VRRLSIGSAIVFFGIGFLISRNQLEVEEKLTVGGGKKLRTYMQQPRALKSGGAGASRTSTVTASRLYPTTLSTANNNSSLAARATVPIAVVAVGGVRSRGASLASSCSVMTPSSSAAAGSGGGLFDVMPLPSAAAGAGESSGDVEMLLGASFRSSGSGQVRLPQRAASAGGGADHVNYWLRENPSAGGGRPVTSIGYHHRASPTANKQMTGAPSQQQQQQQRPATRGHHISYSPGIVRRLGSTPTSVFITQRSRPSSSTSMLNGVLMGGNDPRGVRSPLSPNATSSVVVGGAASPAGHSITAFPGAADSTSSDPNTTKCRQPASTANHSLNQTTTSAASPVTDGGASKLLGGKKKSKRHPLTSTDDDTVDAHQAAIADLLQEVADVTTTCTRMSTAAMRGGGGAAGAGGGPPSPSPGSLDGTTRSGGAAARPHSFKGGQLSHVQHRDGYQHEPEALDAALHSLLGAKFAPLAVSLPSTQFLRRDEAPQTPATQAEAINNTTQESAAHQSVAAAPPHPKSAYSAQAMQLQIAKTMRDMNTQITVKTSLARRDRRNCFGNALSVLRDNKLLHDRLKEHVAKYEEEEEQLQHRRRGGGSLANLDERSSQASGSPRNSPTRGNDSTTTTRRFDIGDSSSFITENRKSAANPEQRKAHAKQCRAVQQERGTLARYLKDASMETYVHNIEQNMSVVRGADRSRDRLWMGLLSFIFSSRAVWSVFEDSLREKENAEFDQLDSSQRSNLHSQSFCSDPLARGLEKNRIMAANHQRRRQLEEHEIDHVRSLISDLKAKTCFVARLGYLLYRRKVRATRGMKMLLTQLAKSIHTRSNISRLLRNVKLIQRQVRKWLHVRQQRTEFTCVQLEYFMTERSTYTRVQCQDTKDFEKRKSSQQQQQGPLHRALTSGGVSTGFNASKMPAPSSPQTTLNASSSSALLSAQRTGRQGSVSFTASNIGSPLAPTAAAGSNVARVAGQRSGSVTSAGDTKNSSGYFGKRLDDAIRFKAPTPGWAEEQQQHTSGVESPRKLRYAAAVLVAKPFLHRIAHRNGKRLGPDPVSARLAALETHALYTTAGAKLAPKMRDRLLRFVYQREEARYRAAKVAWRAEWLVAKKNYSWLQELAMVQAKNRVSPAKLELKQFRWPHVPTMRCLLAPNEMRLLVLLGFTLASEEKIRHQLLQQQQQQQHQLQRAARHEAAAAAAANHVGVTHDDENDGNPNIANNNDDVTSVDGCSEGDDEDIVDDADDEPVPPSSSRPNAAKVAKTTGSQKLKNTVAATTAVAPGTAGKTNETTLSSYAVVSSASLQHRRRPASIPVKDMDHMLELLRGFQALLNLPEVSAEFLA
jgi:hypothetical protein